MVVAHKDDCTIVSKVSLSSFDCLLDQPRFFNVECEYFTGQFNKCAVAMIWMRSCSTWYVYLLTTSGNTKVLPQEVKMHERRPSLDYHGKRMHSEYNDYDDDEKDYFWFVIDPVKNISAFELFCGDVDKEVTEWQWRHHCRWPASTRTLERSSPWSSWP